MALDDMAALDDAGESAASPLPLLGGDMGADEPLDDFGAAISEAFPDNDWTPDRLDAMKEAIRICLESDKAGEYGDSGGAGGADAGLAMIFGPAKKKS